MKKLSFFLIVVLTITAQIRVNAQSDEEFVKPSCGTLTLQENSFGLKIFSAAEANLTPASEILLYIRFEATTLFPGRDDAGNFRSSLTNRTSFLPAPNLTAEQIDEIVRRVESNFSPFNIRVTTDFSDFMSYPPQFREMAIVTTIPQNLGFPLGVGGVSPFTGSRIPNAASFTFSSAYSNNPIDIASTIAHETGHIFGLEHQNLFNSSCGFLNEYHPGFGSGQIRFNPLMGGGFGDSIYNWFAQSCPGILLGIPQNDYVKINFSVDVRPDDFPNAPQTGMYPISKNQITGILEKGGDVDALFINFRSPRSVSVSSDNIDLKVTVIGPSGRVLGVFNDPLDRNVEIPSVVGANYLLVEGESNTNMSSEFMTGSYRIAF